MVCGRPNAICGRMMPASEFDRPRLRIIRYSGVMPTVIGNIRPAENSEYMSGAYLNL